MIKQYKNIKDKSLKIDWGKNWDDEATILNALYTERVKLNNNNPIIDSIYQFKAQTYNLTILQKLTLWIISFFGFIFLLIKYLIKKEKRNITKYDFAYYYEDTILYNKNKNKKGVLIGLNQGILKFQDLLFISKLLLITKFNFSLLSIAIYRIATVRCSISYGVSEIWTNMEFSAASGILKAYCKKNGLTLKNYMHGEKLLSLRDTFSSFDEFYVWNTHYEEMFKKLKCNSKIIVQDPWIEKELKTNYINNKTICYFLKGDETIEEFNRLQNIFNNLHEKNFTIFIKKHPRVKTLNIDIKNVEVLKDDTNIDYIFNQYYYISSQYSTVLYRAHKLNLNILIDDISNPKIFQAIKKRSYYLLSEDIPDYKLSTLIKNI